MEKVFGYRYDFLAHRIYNIVAKGVKDKRLYYSDYMKELHPFLVGTDEVRIRFIFKLYDID